MPKQNTKKSETITVKVGAFPGGQIKSYTLPAGSEAKDALKAANLNAGSANDVRINGAPLSSLDGVTLNNEDQILVFSKIRGNS